MFNIRKQFKPTKKQIDAICAAFKKHCEDGWSPASFCAKLGSARDYYYVLIRNNKGFRQTYLKHSVNKSTLYNEMLYLEYGIKTVKELSERKKREFRIIENAKRSIFTPRPVAKTFFKKENNEELLPIGNANRLATSTLSQQAICNNMENKTEGKKP